MSNAYAIKNFHFYNCSFIFHGLSDPGIEESPFDMQQYVLKQISRRFTEQNVFENSKPDIDKIQGPRRHESSSASLNKTTAGSEKQNDTQFLLTPPNNIVPETSYFKIKDTICFSPENEKESNFIIQLNQNDPCEKNF